MKHGRVLSKTLLSILSIFLPWSVLLIKDNPGGALVALCMQATLIGWLPASMWAWNIVRESHKKKPSKDLD